MGNIGEGILSKIGEYVVEATIDQARYLCCFNNIVKDLQEEETNLTLAKERMEGRVRRARNNTEIIEKDVKKWQSDSSNILEEVAGLRSEIEEKKSCLRWCPNCCCRYWLGRKATKKTVIMKRLVETGKIENVGRLASLPDDLEFLPPKDFEFFPSSKSVFEQIIEALKNDQINLVGLHGMGGTGKTTLARAVGENVKGKTFHKVITVTVSQTPNFVAIQAHLAHSLGLELQEQTEEDRAKRLFKRFVGTDTKTDKKQETEKETENIQAHIAEPLGLKLEEETEKNRAKRLYNRFMGTDTQTDTETDKKPETEKILVILDDVWESFDLRAKIGISFEGDNMGGKVLLTTRLEQVCIDMNCQQRTQLNVLEEEEGLALLKKHAGIGDDSSLFNRVATQVARECGGLPLALVAIGCALKEKEIDEWNAMYRKLQKSKLEDIRYSKVAGNNGIYATLKVSYDYLGDEKSKSCFLLCSLFPEDRAIRFEELVWYAMGLGWYQDADSTEEARSDLLLTVRHLKASGLLLYADEEYVKMHDMIRDIALWIASHGENVFMSKVGMEQIDWSKEKDWKRYTAISLLANKIDELSVGLACSKLEILMLGGESSWKMLKVSDKCFEEMKGLKVLSLTYVDLSLKSLQFLENLKTLQLVRCNTRDISYLEKLDRLEILLFYDPPDVLPREICKLPNLRIVYLNESVRIPSNVLGRCSQLEELYALDEFHNRVEETSMAGIREVISLPGLRTLHLSIYAKCLPKDLAFPKFQRYVICVNTRSYMESYKRALEISHVEAVSLIAFKALYETLEYLRLEEVTGCDQNILPSIDRRFNELKEACISDCDMLQEVFQLEGLYHAGKEVLPMLAKLKLEDLPRLRYIWKGPTQCVNFQSLTNLYINSCWSLEYIFPTSIARDLVLLEELTIKNAPQVKQVFYVDHASEEIVAEIDGKDIVLPKLRVIKLKTLESLTSFVPENYHLTCPTLEELLITECSSLTASFSSAKKLQSLKIQRCPKLRHAFSCNLARNLLSLEKLSIEDCEEMEYIIDKDNEEDHPQPPLFPNLQKIDVEGCGKLKYLFSINITQHLQQLKSIRVERCNQLEKVFEHKDEGDAMNDKEILLPQLKTLCLEELPSLSNFGPVGYHFILKLDTFIIKNCNKMRVGELYCIGRVIVIYGLQRELKSLEEAEDLCKGPTNILGSENLCIIKCQRLKQIFTSNLAQDLLQLRQLYIGNCEELEQIIVEDDEKDHLQTPFFPNLITISVIGCNKLKHLCSVNIAACLQQLKFIRVGGCDQLQNVFAQKNGADEMNGKEIVLPQLKSLSTINCEELEQIIIEDDEKVCIPTAFFQNLRGIDVSRCSKLKHPFSVKIAPHLRQLKSIHIECCDQLQNVFGHKNGADDINDEETWLPQLEHLLFKALPNLTSIGPAGYHFQMRNLKSLIMEGCNDQLWKIYFGDFVGSIRLTEAYYVQEHVTVSFQKDRGCKFTISGVTESDLRCVRDPLDLGLCRGLNLTFTLDNLNKLIINGCHKMRHIFSLNLPQHLLNLTHLYISNCEELEQIIAEDARDPYIPNLYEIEISGCNKLKHVFPITRVRGLLKLKRIVVKECDQLEEVFFYRDGDKVDKDVVFSTLECLVLEKLQRLTNFCFTGYHCIFPSLKEITVKKCPKIATRFSRGKDESVHAESKPPNEGGTAMTIYRPSALPLYVERNDEQGIIQK